MSRHVIAACDGGCKGTPGPDACAFVIADAETYDDAIARAQAGALALSITTEPV